MAIIYYLTEFVMQEKISFTLKKEERLTGEMRIKRLFEQGEAFLVYPLRVIVFVHEGGDGEVKALFSVPKRRFKRASKRNLLKRRMREAYRLHKHLLYASLAHTTCTVDIAFSYISNDLLPFALIESKMVQILQHREKFLQH